MASRAGEHDLIHDVNQRMSRLELQRQTSEVLRHARRDTTLAVHRRAISYLVEYAGVHQAMTLPATSAQLAHFLVYLLCVRQPRLDPSTVDLVSGVVSTWHDAARQVTGLPLTNPCRDPYIHTLLRSATAGLKKPPAAKRPFTAHQLIRVLHYGFDTRTVGGRHGRLLFSFLLLGPLRPGVATDLRIEYALVPDQFSAHAVKVVYGQNSDVKVHDGVVYVSVNHDKNVNAANRRVVPIPSRVLGLDVPADLEHYLKVCGPPSGGTLFAAPAQPRQLLHAAQPRTYNFNPNSYTAACAMVRRAFKRAFPQASDEDLALYAGGSPRKTLAQLVWAVTGDRRVVVDLGGWSSGKEESAVDGYFHLTDEQRIRLLQQLVDKLLTAQEIDEIDADICRAAL